MDWAAFEQKYRIREDMRGTFHDRLFEIIDEKGLSNKDVYTASNIDRKRFSKIQCTPDVKPSKRYILALCIGLKLDRDETIDLLGRADKAINPNDPRDQYVMGFIDKGYYNIWEINDFLDSKDLETLGTS